ncbi:hypothetical protein PORCRE_383 [Porphyromonas crevioricanis JCM 15906]|uniref:Uncharacterized protein n=1 Tax=Porphyromonas crevioricanis JCM 15906 TaxID=1305617 RepID=S4N9D7_9PORP|nr:hypothetical protein PORCRE_383 [Porphyromonas crevioricanis JCM 15906]GAD08026.1 hypothetical protein PORCAN_1656 [Porphyromonas crevioricanis JCM 13913]
MHHTAGQTVSQDNSIRAISISPALRGGCAKIDSLAHPPL